MEGNTGEFHRVRELYKYINHHAGTQKKQGVNNIVGLGILEYISEVTEKDKS